MFCSKCGEKNNDEAKFCKSCGNGIGTTESTATQTPVTTSSHKPKSILFFALAPIGAFVLIVVFWGIVNLFTDASTPSPFIEFVNNVVIPLVIGIIFLSWPIGIIYALISNSRNYDGTIKCGNCNYLGVGKKGRSTWAQVTVWLLFFFFWPITLIYYLVTHNYKCPKCDSTFIGLRDKSGAYSAPRSGAGPLGIVLVVFLAIAVIGILAAVVLASLNDARDAGQDAATKATLSNLRIEAELYYDSHFESYNNFCEDINITTDYICNDTSSGYAITAPLNEGGYFCIDKWSKGTIVTSKISRLQTNCPRS